VGEFTTVKPVFTEMSVRITHIY